MQERARFLYMAYLMKILLVFVLLVNCREYNRVGMKHSQFILLIDTVASVLCENPFNQRDCFDAEIRTIE